MNNLRPVSTLTLLKNKIPTNYNIKINKLFKTRKNGEVFWVKILKKNNNKFKVEVRNDLFCNPYKDGDIIFVKRRDLIMPH